MQEGSWQDWELRVALLEREGGKCVVGLMISVLVLVASLVLGLFHFVGWLWVGPMAVLATLAALYHSVRIAYVSKAVEEAEFEKGRALSEWKPAKEDSVDWSARRDPKPSSWKLADMRKAQEKEERKNRPARRAE